MKAMDAYTSTAPCCTNVRGGSGGGRGGGGGAGLRVLPPPSPSFSLVSSRSFPLDLSLPSLPRLSHSLSDPLTYITNSLTHLFSFTSSPLPNHPPALAPSLAPSLALPSLSPSLPPSSLPNPTSSYAISDIRACTHTRHTHIRARADSLRPGHLQAARHVAGWAGRPAGLIPRVPPARARYRDVMMNLRLDTEETRSLAHFRVHALRAGRSSCCCSPSRRLRQALCGCVVCVRERE